MHCIDNLSKQDEYLADIHLRRVDNECGLDAPPASNVAMGQEETSQHSIANM